MKENDMQGSTMDELFVRTRINKSTGEFITNKQWRILIFKEVWAQFLCVRIT
jgi:hypothetical protein